jgi:hypothetical protein
MTFGDAKTAASMPDAMTVSRLQLTARDST